MHSAPSLLNDYKYMRFGPDYRRCRPQDLYEIHMNTKLFIFENAKRDYPEQKVVVVTHMAPSYQSVSEKYRNTRDQLTNFLYFSDIDQRIYYEGGDIDYWFHGHMHHTTQYEIGTTRVVLNSRGYSGDNPEFDKNLRFAV
jgi:hypothetical protein